MSLDKTLSQAARRAVDTLAADILDRTVTYGTDRDSVLDQVAWILMDKAREIRRKRIDAQ